LEVLEERITATDYIFSMPTKKNLDFNHPINPKKGMRIR
jgi:hypothetical protein